MSSLAGVEVDDLFIHEHGQNQIQAWCCDSISPPVWSPITQGVQRVLTGQTIPRAFVITDGGQPSWVLPDTIGRQYKHVKLEAK